MAHLPQFPPFHFSLLSFLSFRSTFASLQLSFHHHRQNNLLSLQCAACAIRHVYAGDAKILGHILQMITDQLSRCRRCQHQRKSPAPLPSITVVVVNIHRRQSPSLPLATAINRRSRRLHRPSPPPQSFSATSNLWRRQRRRH